MPLGADNLLFIIIIVHIVQQKFKSVKASKIQQKVEVAAVLVVSIISSS